MDFPVPVLMHLQQYLSFRDMRRIRRVNCNWYTVFSKPLYGNILISDTCISVYDSFYYNKSYGCVPRKVDTGQLKQ